MPLLSFPTHTPLFLCPAFSFIHILLPQQRQSPPIELELFLIIISWTLHSSIFPSSGDFTFISSSFTVHSSLFLCWCLPVSSFFPSFMCASLLSSPPPQFTPYSFFISPSVWLVSFCFPLQSLVMRCDKPLPCYHSNRVPVATQQRWWWRVRCPQFSTNTFNFLTAAQKHFYHCVQYNIPTVHEASSILSKHQLH